MLSVFAAAACQKGDFFLLPAWWKYLQVNTSDCSIIFNFPGDLWLVALALLDILLRIGGMVAVVMIIVAGVRYMTSTGNTEKAVSARKTAVNALIGLAITLIATALVAFIGNRIG
jgi:hypothetical protein